MYNTGISNTTVTTGYRVCIKNSSKLPGPNSQKPSKYNFSKLKHIVVSHFVFLPFKWCSRELQSTVILFYLLIKVSMVVGVNNSASAVTESPLEAMELVACAFVAKDYALAAS